MRRSHILDNIHLGVFTSRGGGMAKEKSGVPDLALARLREIMIDPARFNDEPEAVVEYLEPGLSVDGVSAVVCPRGAEDIRQVLSLARGYGFSVYTPIPGGLNPPAPGVIMDFRYMNDVKDIDEKNLFAQVEPGVTWEQLTSELDHRVLRAALPAAAKSPYVLESAIEREVVLPACRFSNRQLSTFHAVLADGREYRSGSDALEGSVAHWREDGGPNISRIFSGSRNSFGIPVLGVVFLYPAPECRKVVARGLPNRKSACAFARRVARSEACTELLVLNKWKSKTVLNGDPGLPTWSVVVGLEGTEKLVKYHEKQLGEYATEVKVKPRKGSVKVHGAFEEALARPWYESSPALGFYTNFNRVEELSEMVEAGLDGKGRFAQMVVPVKLGATVFVHYELVKPADDAGKAVEKLLPRLEKAGAFFANPTGSLAQKIFARQPAYNRLLKDLKGFMDPEDILNTGQVIKT